MLIINNIFFLSPYSLGLAFRKNVYPEKIVSNSIQTQFKVCFLV